MKELIIQLVSAWVGSLGFSLMFNSGTKVLLPGTLGGMLGWAVYLLAVELNLNSFVSAVIAAAFCQIYSEVFARVIKVPKTILYIPAIVPLVPGGSLYYTMYNAAVSNWSQFKFYGMQTLHVAFGIAVGASFVSAIMLLLPAKKAK